MRILHDHRIRKTQILARAVSAFVIFGSIYGVASVAAGIVTNGFQTAKNVEHDELILTDLSITRDAYKPLDQRISERSDLIVRLKDPAKRQEQQRQLASLYEMKGKDNLKQGNFSVAEQCFHNASELDPQNSDYLSDIANLYADAAVRQSVDDHKVDLMKSSTKYYDNALSRTKDERKRRTITNRAAQTSYNLALAELRMPGGKPHALEQLQKAKNLAGPGSSLAVRADRLIGENKY